MGMYTELFLGVEIHGSKGSDHIKALTYMAATQEEQPKLSKDFDMSHPLFKTDRWSWMLRSGGSYYFRTKPCLVFRYDEIANAYFLTLITNIKNYTGEWEQFLDYIAPHIDEDTTCKCIGWIRYEEAEHPTLLYIEDGKIEYKTVKLD